MVNLDYRDKQLLIEALYLKKNMIETGDPILSAEDAVERKAVGKIRALSKNQMQDILYIFALIEKLTD